MAGKKFPNDPVSRFEFLTRKKEISLLMVLQLEKPLSMRAVGFKI